MSNRTEKTKTGIMTALILFATIGLISIVMLPDGTMSPAQAFRSQMPGGGGVGSSPCNEVQCGYILPPPA